MTNVGFVPLFVVRPEEGGLALVAVDALGVVLAVQANAAALEVAMDVQGEAFLVDFRVVLALVAVREAVAGWKNCWCI